MTVKIIFYKSSSKFYDSVCFQCEVFNNYTQEQSINILLIEIEELRSKKQNIELIIGYLKNWTKTEYYLDEKKVTLQGIETILGILNCEQSCKNCMINNEYCFDGSGWGCKYLSSIALRKEAYYPYRSDTYWYDFGHFIDDEWIVDKDNISAQLKNEATLKFATVCKYFDFKRVEDVVKNLSERIAITDDDCDWEYKYRDAPFGMKQTEIIGIKPKEKYSSGFGEGLRIPLNFGTYEDDNESETIEQERNTPSVTFADIGGIDSIVQQVREVIELPLIAPEIFNHYHIKPHKGVLLYGPPGCGKTLIAKAIANEIKAHFISVNGPEILNKYVGQSEANLRKIFEEAKTHSPTVIYFDEFDSISSTRDSDGNPLMASVVNQLLTLMDGVEDSIQICAIASTNRIDMIDEAIKRPGRFDYVIEIQRPSPEGCKSIFKIHTKNMPVDPTFDYGSFVERYLVGSTGAEIAFVVSEAAYNSIRRTIDISELFVQHCSFSATNKNV
ncbi:MAG: AAA family ATPase, partial [Ruminococcus sp.]|nr:AAA family ATPase [Ruminococcus sp.]